MPKLGNKMDTKSDEQFLIIQETIDANNQEADDKDMKNAEKLMNTDALSQYPKIPQFESRAEHTDFTRLFAH